MPHSKSVWPTPLQQQRMRNNVLKALAGRPHRQSAEEEYKERILAQQNHESYLRDRWRKRFSLPAPRKRRPRSGTLGQGDTSWAEQG